MAFSIFRFVAATILTLVFWTFDDPTLINSPFSKTLKSLTWVVRGSSPTSSRNIVPPSATSKYPDRVDVAPVKAPFSCPKSSESIVPSGIAPQFTAINLLCFLCESWWMIFGKDSFPTPLSPVTKTVISVGATLTAFSIALSSPAELPIISNLCFMFWISLIIIKISNKSCWGVICYLDFCIFS